MADRLLHRVKVAARKQAHVRRSDAYRWLRSRHASIAKLMAEHAPSMRSIADEMAAAEITGGRGVPLTARAVARIWARVCRDVAAAPTIKPSRAGPVGWKPEMVKAHSPTLAKPRPRPDAPEGGLSGKAMLDDLWADIEKRSGRR